MKTIIPILFLLALAGCGSEGPPARPVTPTVIDTVQEQHWNNLPVKIRLDAAFSAAETAALNRAMDSWSEAAGKELFEVTLDESPPAYIGRDWNSDPDRADKYVSSAESVGVFRLR